MEILIFAILMYLILGDVCEGIKLRREKVKAERAKQNRKQYNRIEPTKGDNMSRKTVAVLRMLKFANRQLARTDEWATKEYKIGISNMLEEVLFATDNYAGFSFINNDDSETDTLGYFSRQYCYSDKMRREFRSHQSYDGRFGRITA